MTHVSALPLWMQYMWAVAGLLMLMLAVCWTLFIFWPYLRRSEKKHNYSIKLAEEAKKDLAEAQTKLTDAITKLAEGQGKLGDAQKVAIGVQVLTTLVPMFLNGVSSAREKVGDKK